MKKVTGFSKDNQKPKHIITETIPLSDYFESLPAKQKRKCTGSKCLVKAAKEGKNLVRKLFLSSPIIEGQSLQPGEILHIIASNTVDRDREVVLVEGIDRKHFSGSVFFNHRYNHPAGKNLFITTDKEQNPNYLIAKTLLIGGTPETDRLTRLYTEDIEGMGPALQSWSIGFIPMEYHEPTLEEIARFGDSDLELIFSKAELMEYSAVGVPANREALTIAVGKGMIPENYKDYLIDGIDDILSDIDITDDTSLPISITSDGDIPVEIKESLQDIKEELKSLSDMVMTINSAIGGLTLNIEPKSVHKPEPAPELTMNTIKELIVDNNKKLLSRLENSNGLSSGLNNGSLKEIIIEELHRTMGKVN